MTAVAVLALFFLFTIKHFIFDFAYQPPYQWQNKGTYGHMGGIVHSGIHAIVSFAILLFFADFPIALGLALFEFIVHYHVDWGKMNLNKRMGWTATTHNEFWVLLGVDQLLHYITYIVMIGYLL